MCLSIEVAVWVVYYLFGFNGKIHADFRFPFSFLGIFAHLSSGFFWSPASGKGCLDVAYKRPLPPSPFLRLRRCPGTARSAAFCLLYTITDFPLWAKALLRKEKLLPFLLCAASPPSGEVSRSGCRLGRLLQGRTINGSSLHVPPASSTAVPSACCKKYVGKSCSFPHWDCFLPAGVIFSSLFLSLSLFFSLSFPAGKIPPASPWNCPDMLLCGGRGRKSGMSEGSWEQKVFFCFAGSGSLSCKPAVLCACPGLLLPSLLMGSCTHSCFHAATNCLIQALVQLQRSSGPLCAVS